MRMELVHSIIYSRDRGTRLFRHALFWGADIVAYLLIVSDFTAFNKITLYYNLLRLPLVIVATYVVLYYIMPAFSDPARRGRAWLASAGVLLWCSVGVRAYKHWVLAPILDPGGVVPVPIGDVAKLTSEVLGAMLVISSAIVIKLLKNRTELTQRNEKLQEEKREAELNFLKAQMHPHFLFNTLNTLYSETMQDSGKAQAVVLHLSNLLRFILEECNKPRIPIGYEIKAIHDFVELEKLRHGSRLQVSMQVSDVDLNQELSPLILLPFVENSFKHTLQSLSGTIRIQIQIIMEGNRLHLLVTNDRSVATRSGGPHGMGIANVRRQLDLLYGNTYSLVAGTSGEHYKVSLLIPVKK